MEDWEMHGVNPFRKIHRYIKKKTDYQYIDSIDFLTNKFFLFTKIGIITRT